MEIFTKQQPRFAVDMESMLSLPATVFWKDIKGVFLGCNDVMAELASISSRHAVVGLTDVELIGEKAAMQFVDNDREVIESGRTLVFDEYFRDNKGILIKGVSTKAPLFDLHGNLAGLWGVSFLETVSEDPREKSTSISSASQSRYHHVLNQTQQLTHRHVKTKPDLIDALSTRERQCLQLVAKGLSAKAIGEALELSKRTVETYIDNVKSKLGCINKTELVVAAIKHKYIDVES